MRILIFGGSGPSGIALIRKALEVYHDSTLYIYVRSPQKIPEDLTGDSSVVIIHGSLTELDKVEAALLGKTVIDDKDSSNENGNSGNPVDVVLSALGPTGPFHSLDRPITKFYESLIDIMAKHSVKRLVVLSTPSHLDPNDQCSLVMFGIVSTVSTLAYPAYAEFRDVGEMIRRKGEEKGLEWTIVRVPILTNQDWEGFVAGYVGDGKTGSVLARKAFAAFCIGEIEKKEWVGKAPFISNAA